MSSTDASQLENASLVGDAGGTGYSAGPDPFYIQSKLDSSNWVLAAKPDGKGVALARKSGEFRQLWTRVESNIPGSFYVVNLETGTRLKPTGLQGAAVVLGPLTDDSDAYYLWRLDGPHGSEKVVFLTTYVDWQQKLNCAGNGPYNEKTAIIVWEYSRSAHNELWYFAADSKDYRVDRIAYDLDNKRLDITESRGAAETVDNRKGKVPIKTNVHLSYTVVESASFTSTESKDRTIALTESIGITMSTPEVPMVGKASITAGFKVEVRTTTTTTLSKTNASDKSTTNALNVEVEVPAGARSSFQVLVRNGSLIVPYTAYVSRTLPDGKRSAPVATRGEFRGTNSVEYEVIALDPNQPNKAPEVVTAKALAGG